MKIKTDQNVTSIVDGMRESANKNIERIHERREQFNASVAEIRELTEKVSAFLSKKNA